VEDNVPYQVDEMSHANEVIEEERVSVFHHIEGHDEEFEQEEVEEEEEEKEDEEEEEDEEEDDDEDESDAND